MHVTVEFGGRTWRADLARALDIFIPLDFTGTQATFFGAPRATATPLQVGSFSGAVSTGASCNCATYTITPHCNGTHTESFGHLTSGLRSVHDLAREALVPAHLITVDVVKVADAADEHDPVTAPTDGLITAKALTRAAAAESFRGIRALVVRTRPHKSAALIGRNEDVAPTPYFTTAAMRWIVSHDIEHLVVDVPSLDRADDGGHLLCHRIFWGMPKREADGDELRVARASATVTEFAHIAADIADGVYLLTLQVAPFVADAAPSRPLLYPVEAL